MVAVDRVLLYIHATSTLGLLLCGNPNNEIKLQSTVDVSHATHLDMKSHTGGTNSLSPTGASVLTICKKQTITADSTAMAEFVGAHHISKAIAWIRDLLSELGFPQLEPTVLFEDNQSTIQLLNNPGNGGKTRYISLKYNIVREMIHNNEIQMVYLPSEEMTSDMLTKALGPTQFVYLRKKLLGYHVPNDAPPL
jgi:hypothetical protein